MNRILHIAWREFVATVATKGFIIGLLLMPAIMAGMVALGPRVLARFFDPPLEGVSGQVAIADPTGTVTAELRRLLDPETLAARRAQVTEQALAEIDNVTPAGLGELGGDNADLARRALQTALGQVPDLTLVEVGGQASSDDARAWLTATDAERRFAVIAIHPDAVMPTGDSDDRGAYDLYVPPELDDRLQELLQRNLRDAIVSARMSAAALDRTLIDTLLQVRPGNPIEIGEGEARESVEAFDRTLPMAFLMLMFIGVMTGGQGLLTTMVEEKSSRVVEVLLSAVSPFELLAGKLLGQMGVSLVALSMYVALGVFMLVSFALVGLLDPWLIVYFAVFFVIAYLVVGSFMMTIGAAVNEMREAQSLMMPIMLLLMLPWFVWIPITRDPNSVFSVTVSFIPPVNCFAMLLRLTSSTPPPGWQVALSIAVGLASVVAVIWFASKVFRIGLLMHGRPPNLATLLRWAREA